MEEVISNTISAAMHAKKQLHFIDGLLSSGEQRQYLWNQTTPDDLAG